MQSVESLETAVERLSLMAGNLEETMAGLEQRLREMQPGAGQIEQLVATTAETVVPAELLALETRLAEAERQIASLQASAAQALQASVPAGGRRTLPASAASLLAKHGVGESGRVEASVLDAALVSLPVEQRIAVKSQLLRAGLLD